PFNAGTYSAKRQMTEEKITMKAIVVTDRAAGTAGMKLLERPEPQAAINDVVVQVYASGFVPTELTWPSTWTDLPDVNEVLELQVGGNRTRPLHWAIRLIIASTVTEHRRSPGTSWPEWSPPSDMARRVCRWDSGCSASRTGIATARWPSMWRSRHATSRRCQATSTSRWARACRSRASPRGRDCSNSAAFRRARVSSRTARPAQSVRW